MLERLTVDSPHYAEAWRLYEASFPADMRRAPEDQRRALTDPRYAFVARAGGDGGKGVEAVFGLWSLEGFSFLEYFAVRPELRGRGIGTLVMRDLLAGSASMVLEVEPPHDEESRRRISFYEGLGFVLNPFPYLQPPYGPGKQAVGFLLMSHPGGLRAEDFDRVRRRLYADVYGVARPLEGESLPT
ncbi:MAG: GNAT family N-acetyltransferase [Planctomycetes bacterium]|nr:GNAT family N-acetyltransferase [Planctomycetota bacterium]